ncbi:MAG: SUF system NifU family Fe-S cluster assembly protein [Proteobacteria bacterium]|nr:SUF system NifU family Fe-S cluster assembly protein [Pseudomonadota bacterium]
MGLDQLYQQTVLAHNREPQNFYEMKPATHTALGNNALCGDELRVYLEVDKGKIISASFQGEACAIATASASMMTEWLVGRTLTEARIAAADFENMLYSRPFNHKLLAGTVSLEPVKAFPSRIKSATLCWHAMCAALDGVEEVTTEE